MDDPRLRTLSSRRQTLAGVAAALLLLPAMAEQQSAACLAVGKRCTLAASQAARHDHGTHKGKGGTC